MVAEIVKSNTNPALHDVVYMYVFCSGSKEKIADLRISVCEYQHHPAYIHTFPYTPGHVTLFIIFGGLLQK